MPPTTPSAPEEKRDRATDVKSLLQIHDGVWSWAKDREEWAGYDRIDEDVRIMFLGVTAPSVGSARVRLDAYLEMFREANRTVHGMAKDGDGAVYEARAWAAAF